MRINSRNVRAVASGCQALAREMRQLSQRGLFKQRAFHPYGGYQAPFAAMQVPTVEVNPRGDVVVSEVRSQLEQFERDAGAGALFTPDEFDAMQRNFSGISGTYGPNGRDWTTLSQPDAVLAGMAGPKSLLLWGLYEDAFLHPWIGSRMNAAPTGTSEQAKADEKQWLTAALKHYSSGDTVLAVDEDLDVLNDLAMPELRLQRVEDVMRTPARVSFRFEPSTPWHTRVVIPKKLGIYRVA